MVKPYFTRKNLIAIALTALYSLLFLFTGVCLTPGSGSVIAKDNPIMSIANTLGFKSITLEGVNGFVPLMLVALYIVIFVIALIYEGRFAKVNGKKVFSLKMILIYFATLVLCVGLSYGIGLFLQEKGIENIANLSLFLFQSLVVSFLIYVMLAILIGAIAMLVINFILIDKPYRFFSKNSLAEFDDNIEKDEDVTANFTDTNNILSGGSTSAVAASQVTNNSQSATLTDKVEELDDRDKVFPALSNIDAIYGGSVIDKEPTDDITLDKLCDQFRKYLSKEEHLYFDIDVLRYFISGLACSKLSILEGLSGTGKSSLPRYFAKFVNGKVSFFPVQATWRDKSSVLGYFNDFTKSYTETDFLRDLYEANYTLDKINIFVLDEMNISRVEYYFADFLSVLEYPVEERKIRIMQLPHGFFPPAKLIDGNIQIPENVYFVGTANKDDSTFAIADKVYDRAITIYFENINDKFDVKEDVKTINLSNSKLQELYANALTVKDNQMTKEDLDKFKVITDYIYKTFDVTFGNRIMNQINTIVPIFVACGGSKEDAIDLTLSRKLLVKLEGHFEEYVKSGLKKLLDLMAKTYGEGRLQYSERIITNLLRKL